MSGEDMNSRDIIFMGGTILTQDASQPEVEALAVRAGRILALGSEAEVRVQASTDAVSCDLAGRCLLPGFHDSHVHLTRHGLELAQLDLQSARTLQEGLALVRERARALEPGQWLQGSGFLMSRWGVSSLSRLSLDEVAPRNPVFLQSQDHHSAWLNSEALRRAGIDRDTPDPPGGAIVRDESGEPSGVLLEYAKALVQRVLSAPSAGTLREALWDAAQDFARLGVTTVHHMAYEPNSYWRQLALSASRDDYPIRVWACLDQEHIEAASALGLASGQGGRNFQVGGAKFFADGALGSMTALMLEPYAGTSERGMALHDKATLLTRLPLAIAAGLTPVIHAIGDRANREVLDALEATRHLWQPLGMRPRIEHVQHIHPSDAGRLAELGVTASLQPIHLRFDGPRIRELLLDRLGGAHAWRRLLGHGTRIALGSDTPVATPDVLLSLHTALTREDEAGQPLGPEGALTLDEALAGYTRGAAHAIGWEDRSGALCPGFDADLVLLSHDPRQGLGDVSVHATMKGGVWTYRSENAP